MTERIYYRNSFLRDFDAHVVSCESSPAECAGKASFGWWVALDETAFYPTSGGQPHDTGRLGDAMVVDVFEREDGTIIHVTDRELTPGPVRGSVDWARRFDHMQQHSGSHLMSAAFLALFDIQTVSYHMSKTISTIDVSAPSLSAEQLENAERYVNEVIFEDRPIRARCGTAFDLAAMGVRKEAEREGILRAIEIEGVDIQACGGTHVGRTGQVGMILIRRMKKMRENWRVEFVCGQRARQMAREDFTLVEEISQRLTCGAAKIHDGIARIQNERNAAIRISQRHLAEVAALQAKELLAKSGKRISAGLPRPVMGILADADMEYLRSVASNLIAEPGVVALLGSEANGFIVMAKSKDASGDMGALLREALADCGGKGGGTKDFAQGSAPEAGVLDGVLRHAAERACNAAPSLRMMARNSITVRSGNELLRCKGKMHG